nr:MAG TPA: hypothetical protein [Bacteriophage sp.]
MRYVKYPFIVFSYISIIYYIDVRYCHYLTILL